MQHIRKDVLYCDAAEDPTRRAMRTVFDHLFQCLTTWLAPVLCFTAEEAWWARYGDQQDSVHLQSYPDIPDSWQDEKLAKKFQAIREMRKVMTEALELARSGGSIGSSLQANLTVFDPDSKIDTTVDWPDMAIASTVTVVHQDIPEHAHRREEAHNVGVVVDTATGNKCQRCWKVLEEVGQHPTYDDLCNRCVEVVEVTPDSLKTVGS